MKVEALNRWGGITGAVDDEVSRWLAGLEDTTYNKLVAVGLATSHAALKVATGTVKPARSSTITLPGALTSSPARRFGWRKPGGIWSRSSGQTSCWGKSPKVMPMNTGVT